MHGGGGNEGARGGAPPAGVPKGFGVGGLLCPLPSTHPTPPPPCFPGDGRVPRVLGWDAFAGCPRVRIKTPPLKKNHHRVLLKPVLANSAAVAPTAPGWVPPRPPQFTWGNVGAQPGLGSHAGTGSTHPAPRAAPRGPQTHEAPWDTKHPEDHKTSSLWVCSPCPGGCNGWVGSGCIPAASPPPPQHPAPGVSPGVIVPRRRYRPVRRLRNRRRCRGRRGRTPGSAP